MADVSIDSAISTTSARGLRSLIWTPNPLNGYFFYTDSTGDGRLKGTNDGGVSWGGLVDISWSATTTLVAYDMWADWWTPGDTGTKIHVTEFDTTNDIVYYWSFNTVTQTGTGRVAAFTGASAVAGRGAFASITKTRSGYIYIAFDLDAGAERGLVRSTDGGTNWSANLATTFVEATIDQCLLFPATGTGDDNDCWAIYQDASVDSLTMKMWDSSAVAEVESSSMQTMIENVTDLTGQMGFTGAIRQSDGALIVVSSSDRDTATADMQCWVVTGVTAASLTGITAKTNITTDIDDNYYPAVFIDQSCNDIFVAYNGKKDGSETLGTTTKIYYVRSRDGGTTWSAEQTYQEGAASATFQVWTSLSGSRFYVGWRVGTTMIGNFVSSIDLATPIELTMQPLLAPRSGR